MFISSVYILWWPEVKRPTGSCIKFWSNFLDHIPHSRNDNTYWVIWTAIFKLDGRYNFQHRENIEFYWRYSNNITNVKKTKFLNRFISHQASLVCVPTLCPKSPSARGLVASLPVRLYKTMHFRLVVNGAMRNTQFIGYTLGLWNAM